MQPNAYLTQQNMVGNVPLGDPAYYFRPVPPAHTHRAPYLPMNYAGGDLGFESTGNPVTPINSDGRYVEFPRDFSFKTPTYVHIDSAQRDMASYPSPATFRLIFPAVMRGVFSVEVLNVNYPNPETPPADRYVLLLNGMFNSNGFTAQTPNMGIYTPMVSSNLAANQATQTVSKYALAKMHYDTTRPDQCWRKSEVRQIKYFFPIRDQLECIEFTLAYSDGTPLDIDVDDNWSATLEIVAKST